MGIVVDGVGTSRKTPAVYLRVYPGTSGVGGTANKVCVLVGQKLAGAGSMSAGAVELCNNVTHSIALAGQGSELHLLAKGFYAANPGGVLYLGCLTPGTTVSTRTITFAGAAAADGTYKCFLNGNEMSLSIPNGQSAINSAIALTAAVQAAAWYGDLPCTIADNGAGVNTLTTKNLGPQSQWALAPVYQDTSGMPTGQTATLAATTPSAGNAPTVTTIVTTLGAADYDYIGWSVVDSTATGAVEAYVDTQTGPLVGYRQQMIFGSADSYANTVTMAQTNINHRRCQVAWNGESDREVWCETIGREVGLRSYKEDADPAYPYNWEKLPGFRPHHSPGSYPSQTVIENCLNNSITPIGVRGGNGCVVRSVTSYSRAGATPDYSCLDTATVTVPDYLADILASVLYIRFAGKKCAADYAEPSDTPPGVVTPKMIKDVLYQELKRAEAAAIVSEITDAVKAQIDAQKDAVAVGRINFECPVPVMEGMYIIAGNVRGA